MHITFTKFKSSSLWCRVGDMDLFIHSHSYLSTCLNTKIKSSAANFLSKSSRAHTIVYLCGHNLLIRSSAEFLGLQITLRHRIFLHKISKLAECDGRMQSKYSQLNAFGHDFAYFYRRIPTLFYIFAL